VRLRTSSYILAALLAATAGYLGVAQTLAAANTAALPPLFDAVGSFLFRSFRVGGFYIPLYLFITAGLLLAPELKRRLLFGATAAVVPVLTASLILQLMAGAAGPAARAVGEVFGLRMGAFLLLLLLAAELLAIYLLTFEDLFGTGEEGQRSRRRLLSAPEKEGEEAAAETEPPHEAPFFKIRLDGESVAGMERNASGFVRERDEHAEEEAEDSWSYFERRNGSVSFPDMPELPELRSLRRDRLRSGGETASGEEEQAGGNGHAEARKASADFSAAREYVSFREYAQREPEEEYRDSGESASLLQQEEPEFEELKESGEQQHGHSENPETNAWLKTAPHASQYTALQDSSPRSSSRSASAAAEARGEESSERSFKPAEEENEGAGDASAEALAGKTQPHQGQEQKAQTEKAQTEKAQEQKPLPSLPNVQLVPQRYDVPEEELLHEYPDSRYWVIDEETQKSAEVLKNTLEEFKISAEVTGIQKGPVITMFEILPAPGVKLSKIVNLADNIALRLAASRVRIVAPIPGKHAVGIEVPNKKRHLVSFKEMLQSEEFQEAEMEIPLILGKDITGQTQIVDLVQTPHLLIAGATGSGKSVSVNGIIASMLYQRSPEEVRMILIDPKIVELKLYNDIPHLLTPVITEPKRAFQALQYCLYEMERRYSLLDSLGVRDIKSYNRKIKSRKLTTRPLPYIVVVVDEFADLMATSGKELEATLARLAAMSRAVGIHLVLATQRPSIDVITGLIKANIPSRIAFMVASKFDSRIILDAVGAEKLLGKGDMLFASAWNPNPVRMQGAYLSEEEVERLAEYVKSLGEPDYIDEEIFFEDDEEQGELFNTAANDPLLDKAVGVVAEAGKASASYLQRRLKIGYNRAARLVEEMEERGIVGPQNGSKPREILHIPEKHRE